MQIYGGIRTIRIGFENPVATGQKPIQLRIAFRVLLNHPLARDLFVLQKF